jgi:hypothetical protein
MKRTITLTNDFHNTEVNLQVGDDDRISLSQAKRARRELCGIKGCLCGDDLGMRGHQPGNCEISPYHNGREITHYTIEHLDYDEMPRF